ncbi:MAG: hypothetical protein M1825_003785 [Sarcosagium campestre]|nr:MAG: hypothetical protein M1825_003785 [Sarcosagium campestre]
MRPIVQQLPASCRRSRILFTSAVVSRNGVAAAAPTKNLNGARRWIQSQGFQPFVPPSPASLPKAAPPKQFRRTRRLARGLIYLAIGSGVVYAVDRQFYAAALTRSLRTFSLGLVVALDYKINFRAHPPLGGTIAELHARNAERLFDLLRTNGGLYLKIGQAIAMQSAILPAEFQQMFAKMFDDAPQNTWKDVDTVIREDFGGKSPEEVFGVSFDGDASKGIMERTARASASVAQVHWARLADGREVAVKVQKREIAQQVGWDLWAFKVITYIYSTVFDLPFYSLVPYITERLELETDFENEADNSERMAKLVAGDSRLAGRVYIPKVYRELSTRRVMTAEWIEGVRLWDKQTMAAPWKGGWRTGSPGCHGAPLDPPSSSSSSSTSSSSPRSQPQQQQQDRKHPAIDDRLKPERTFWRGPNGDGGLGVSVKQVMTTMVDLFSAQMFLWGWVHCDPHPGNIFIRRQPGGAPELVLIDHGLYIHLDPGFRHEYARFWKSLLAFDNAALAEIVRGWGINNADMFASATLMRPYAGGDMSTSASVRDGVSGRDRQERAFAAQQKMRHGIRDVLGSDAEKWPRELIFLGRNLRIVQGNNQFLGSPVNRIKITGVWASRALVESPDLAWRAKLANLGRHLVFEFVLFASDLVFWASKARQLLGLGRGMEDDMEAQVRGIAKETFGVDLQHGVFEG